MTEIIKGLMCARTCDVPVAINVTQTRHKSAKAENMMMKAKSCYCAFAKCNLENTLLRTSNNFLCNFEDQEEFNNKEKIVFFF